MTTLAIIADTTFLIVRDMIVPAAIVAAIVLRVGRRWSA